MLSRRPHAAAQVRAVASLPEEVRVDERSQCGGARLVIEVPQTARLASRQLEVGHFDVLHLDARQHFREISHHRYSLIHLSVSAASMTGVCRSGTGFVNSSGYS